MVGYRIADTKDRGVFDELYTLRKYHKAGGNEFVYVVEFVFDEHAQASLFATKIERLRK
jgi:hypothetical protein